MIDLALVVILLILLILCVLGISILLAAFITGVPFVPTNKPAITMMIKMAQFNPGQIAYDLGSGLGHVLFSAPKNVRRVGYERIIFLIWGSKIKNILKKDSVEFYKKDFFKVDLNDADVLFCYLFPQIMERFQQEIWPQIPVGCRVISNGFPMPNIAYNQKQRVGKSTIYLYIKP